MQNHQQEDKQLGAGGHALVGAGVGAAGVGSSIGLIGLSAGLAVLPISIRGLNAGAHHPGREARLRDRG
jgi:hypothetical protein